MTNLSPSRPIRISQQRTDAGTSKQMTTDHSKPSLVPYNNQKYVGRSVPQISDRSKTILSDAQEIQSHIEDHMNPGQLSKEHYQRMINRKMSQQFGQHSLFNSQSNLVLDKPSQLVSQRDEAMQMMAKKVRKRKRDRGSKDLNKNLPTFQSRALKPSESAISLLQNSEYAIQQRNNSIDNEPSHIPHTQEKTLSNNFSRNRLLLQ